MKGAGIDSFAMNRFLLHATDSHALPNPQGIALSRLRILLSLLIVQTLAQWQDSSQIYLLAQLHFEHKMLPTTMHSNEANRAGIT